MDAEKIRIDPAEVADPRVDEALARQGSFGMRPAPALVEDRKASLLFRPWLVLMVAGALGGLAGWVIIEPFLDDGLRIEGRVDRVTPDPMGERVTVVRVSGVPVLLTDLTRVTRDGTPATEADIEPARRVSVRGTEITRGTEKLLLAHELELLPGEAPGGEVSMSAAHLRNLLVSLATFPVIAALVGLFLAAADGLLSRTWRRAALCGLVGLSSGLALGLVTTIIGQLVYLLGRTIVEGMEADGGVSTAAFVTQMVARGVAWAVTGVAMGLGQGIALRSKRMLVNGLVGGVVGALVGGMLFDPLDRLLHGETFGQGAEASRALGFAVIGLGAGLMIGVVELLARDAWLKMLAGPLAGKEFMLYRNPTVIGSSPKAEVYLFKDAEVEPTHALIHLLGEGYELESVAGPSRTRLNGLPVRRARLESGDQIRIGKTVLSFGVKEGG